MHLLVKLIDNGDRPFNYFAEKQEMKPVEQSSDEHYKRLIKKILLV
jgi:hypothetical protein